MSTSDGPHRRHASMVGRGFRWVLLVLATVTLLVGCSTGVGVDGPRAPADGSSSAVLTVDRPVDCPPPTLVVSTADALQDALAQASPGTVIGLADGTYEGEFAGTAVGSAQTPIWLCGSKKAVLRGPGIGSGVVLHLSRAANWRVLGFSITGGQKGLLTDGVTASVFQDLNVSQIGDEAVHLRSGSSDNVVRGLTITGTGLRTERFGEGIYVGSAASNWCRISQCQPDRSDRNIVVGSTITQTTAESVDIKEGTTGGLLRGNVFDGSGLRGEADSWVDVKGNNWLIENNRGAFAAVSGYQVHAVSAGWGTGNVFVGNIADVQGSGYGFELRPVADNVVTCTNVVTGAALGFSNATCR